MRRLNFVSRGYYDTHISRKVENDSGTSEEEDDEERSIFIINMVLLGECPSLLLYNIYFPAPPNTYIFLRRA